MMLGVVAGESGLIGYGWGDPIRVPQVWISDTGSTWVANPIQADESPAISTHHGVMSWLDTSVIRSGVASIELRTSRDGLDWTSVGVVEETRHTGIGAFRAGDPGVLQIGGSLDRPAIWLFTAPSR
jgi:hypothetical protein